MRYKRSGFMSIRGAVHGEREMRARYTMAPEGNAFNGGGVAVVATECAVIRHNATYMAERSALANSQ